MQTRQASYLDFLGTPGTQLSIPVFQRQYSWGVWQCEELWEDILAAGKASEEHFIGSPKTVDNGTDQLAFNAALRCWLVGKDSSLEKHNRHELYSVFRKFVNESYEGTIEELMGELLEHCRSFKEQIRGPQVKRHLDWTVGEAPAGAANRIFGLN